MRFLLIQTPTSLHQAYILWRDHELMHRFRGRECGVERAEAYVRVNRKGTAQPNLPGLIP
jgi:hypothetical protein